MSNPPRILLTGAAGFIGSCLAHYLFRQQKYTLVLVDDFSRTDKRSNYETLPCERVERTQLQAYLQAVPRFDWVIHLGARTDTTEMNYTVHEQLNLHASKELWQYCTLHQIPFIYASSAATYGDGALGYQDDEHRLHELHPLNPYGLSKHQFDLFAVQQEVHPPFWCGLKFFNVYGPNEYHKGRMASVVYHAYNQILQNGRLRLFRSHRPDYKDGEQKRDFIYVTDILSVTDWLLLQQAPSGIYNLGTGAAATFLQLAQAVFHAMDKEVQIDFIDTPEDIRDTYQYFTEADMHKLIQAGYHLPFQNIDHGVNDYVRNYLRMNRGY